MHTQAKENLEKAKGVLDLSPSNGRRGTVLVFPQLLNIAEGERIF